MLKRSRHSQRMLNPQFYVSGKRPHKFDRVSAPLVNSLTYIPSQFTVFCLKLSFLSFITPRAWGTSSTYSLREGHLQGHHLWIKYFYMGYRGPLCVDVWQYVQWWRLPAQMIMDRENALTCNMGWIYILKLVRCRRSLTSQVLCR